MEFRILTGILKPQETPGYAIITFNPHAVLGDAVGVELSEIGEKSDFRAPPGRVVSLRKITVSDAVLFWDTETGIVEMFEIRDDSVTKNQMVVRWRTSGGGRIDEIAYMIVGEA
jgi:hypothetical protein